MSLRNQYKEQIDECVRVCGLLADKGYITSEGGNLAVRLTNDLILVTPTRLYKGNVRDCDMVFINADGEPLESDRKPTGEKPLYLEIFRRRPDIRSIVHAHPPAACAFAIAQGENPLLRPYFPETILECGPTPVVPYAEPLTQKLPDQFVPYLDRHNTFIMENHGVLVLSPGGIMSAFGLVDIIEGTARSILYALSAGLKLKEIPREEVLALENTMRSRGAPFPGKPGVVKSLVELYY